MYIKYDRWGKYKCQEEMTWGVGDGGSSTLSVVGERLGHGDPSHSLYRDYSHIDIYPTT